MRTYADKWQYQLNADKSSVMVLGESAKTRLSARSSRKWYIGQEEINETDEQHHLGILRTVFTSTIHRTSERCTTARSSFFDLNSIGSRFGCLHPLTSYRLYQTLCIPILLYGAEISSDQEMDSEVIQTSEVRIPNGDLPVGGWSVRLEGALATITSLHSSRNVRYEVSPRCFLIKAFQGEPL